MSTSAIFVRLGSIGSCDLCFPHPYDEKTRVDYINRVPRYGELVKNFSRLRKSSCDLRESAGSIPGIHIFNKQNRIQLPFSSFRVQKVCGHIHGQTDGQTLS